MALLNSGYWQTTYWQDNFWQQDYWLEFGIPDLLNPGYWQTTYWPRAYWNKKYWLRVSDVVVYSYILECISQSSGITLRDLSLIIATISNSGVISDTDFESLPTSPISELVGSFIKINPISPYTSGLAKYMGTKGLKAMTGIDHSTNRNRRTVGVDTYYDDLVSSLIVKKGNKYFAIEIWQTKKIAGIKVE